jgi:hypothetical protein
MSRPFTTLVAALIGLLVATLASLTLGMLVAASLVALVLPNVALGWTLMISLLTVVFVFTFITVFREMRDKLTGEG